MLVATKSSGPGAVGYIAAATRCLWLCLLWMMITTGSSAADLLWGVNGHPFNAYPGISIERQLDFIHDLGMKSYRVNISNADSAGRLAELIKAGKVRGIEILPVITPELDLDHTTADELYAQAYRLASTLVSRFKDDIRVWELGNEMENYAILSPCEMKDDGAQYSCSWGPASGLETSDYFSPRWVKVSAVLRGLSDATIAVDPTIRKAMGTAGWGHRAAFTRMRQDGIRWDISVWHLYEGDPEEAFKFLATFGKPIWLTEFNYSGGSQRGEREQAEGLLETMNLLRKYQSSYDVQAAHIYELLDETYWAPSYEAFMGLVRLEKRGGGLWTPSGEKPAYEAVKKFIAEGDLDFTLPTTTATSPALVDQTSAPSPEIVRAIHPCSPDDIDKSSFNHANQVAYAYCLLLHRMPSPVEQWNQIVALKTDPSISSTLLMIMNSAEFKTGNLPAGLGNVKYITVLYRVLLGRDPDNNGLDSYVGRLSINKVTRQDIVSEFTNSYEFRSKHPFLFSTQQALQ
ncbi:DUF4214 domain-containing protein [Mesorhizobium sp. ES1-1]|uniref:DUF4214 domain-containing protein n=1 Tax=Mesorhizobium sp. ES1-1 TaxID=2876629 RepID=UPI001CCA7BEA|nr:DUF4214 domain-containing protein [Mesorhizobium sp. ES1-1]MBZ9677677.1 DUF4214 domain-containing protein [Mesorhizobium sp. ES1-1]